MHDQTIPTTQAGQCDLTSSTASGTPAEVTIESLTDNNDLCSKIRDIGYGRLSEFQAKVVPAFLENKDILGQGPKRGRSLAFGMGLAIIYGKGEKNRTFVITDTEGDADRLARGLSDLGVASVKIGGKTRANKNQLTAAVCLVGTTQGFLDAFDQGVIDGVKVNRAILDGTESAIQSGRMDELLNLLHDLPQTHIVLFRGDPSINISNFVTKFLKSPVEVLVEDNGQNDAEPAPQERESRGRYQREREPRQSESRYDEVATPPAAPAKPKKVPSNAIHLYLELGGDLLAKPNALCDFIAGEGSPSTVVFCNSPSEADLTDVVLKKRGITSRKLVGFVPPAKITSAVEALKAKEITVLVLTDISAREIQIADLGLVVNYSSHSDPEVYLQRTSVAEEGANPVKVVSLVTPLDLANFHYLKKLVSVEFSQGTLPSPEVILKKRIDSFAELATAKALTADERIKGLVTAILADPRKDEMLSLLVYNTFDALPAALAAADKAKNTEGSYDSRGSDDDRDDRRDRDNDYGGREEGGRGRGRGRFDRRGRGRDNYDDRGGSDEGFNNREGSQDASFSEGSDDQQGRGGRRDRRRRDEGETTGDAEQQFVPPVRDLRLYVGHGNKEGMSKDKLTEILTSKGELTADQIKRTITRELYSFVDVPEAVAEGVIAKLADSELSDGSKFFIKKAVSITAPREERRPAEGESAEGTTELSPAPAVEGTEPMAAEV